jgi:hypothetical protein
LFLLGDQPLVTPKTIDLILAAYQSSPSPIVIPVFEGRRGNPVLFRRDTFSRLEALDSDCGARPLFKEYTGLILRVPVPDSSIHFDIDTEEDYRRLLQLERQCPLSRSNQKKVRNTPPEGQHSATSICKVEAGPLDLEIDKQKRSRNVNWPGKSPLKPSRRGGGRQKGFFGGPLIGPAMCP